jgi:hypothetical protein
MRVAIRDKAVADHSYALASLEDDLCAAFKIASQQP